MKQGLVSTNILMSILTMGIVSMILVFSQSPAAFAGGCDGTDPNFDCDDDGFTPNQGDCDDLRDYIVPGEGGCPIVEVQDLQEIIDQVNGLITSGDLEINKGQTNAILGKLDKAMGKLESGNNKAAAGSLNAFSNQINAFINAGSFSDPNDGQKLIVAVQSIIKSL